MVLCSKCKGFDLPDSHSFCPHLFACLERVLTKARQALDANFTQKLDSALRLGGLDP
jgi:hypothetical protein